MFKKLIVGVAIFLLGLTATVDASQKTLVPSAKQTEIIEGIRNEKATGIEYVDFDKRDGGLNVVTTINGIDLGKKSYTVAQTVENGERWKKDLIKNCRLDLELLKGLVYLLDNFTNVKQILIAEDGTVFAYFEVHKTDLGL